MGSPLCFLPYPASFPMALSIIESFIAGDVNIF